MYYGLSYAMEEQLLAGLFSGMIGSIPSAAISLFSYIFTAYSLYTIAKRREIPNAWLSWIPVANIWILGSISDQYRYVVRGEDRSKRKILIGLRLVRMVLGMVACIILTVSLVEIVTGTMMGVPGRQQLQDMMAAMTGAMALMLPWLGVVVAEAVIRYIALYDLYASCEPENKTLYLVLSILIGITEPVFLFICRHKDQGMPPRRVIPQSQWQQMGGEWQ